VAIVLSLPTGLAYTWLCRRADKFWSPVSVVWTWIWDLRGQFRLHDASVLKFKRNCRQQQNKCPSSASSRPNPPVSPSLQDSCWVHPHIVVVIVPLLCIMHSILITGVRSHIIYLFTPCILSSNEPNLNFSIELRSQHPWIPYALEFIGM
jgi:hypothetical protein